ncbi:MAG: hypothetical protein EBR34_08005 [Sphingomonadaceae bacterium]|nr:hypothetical protein [Sphingomonadaceae bacterium]
MNAEAIEAWTALYAAVGLLALICAFCALAKTIWDIRTGTLELPAETWRQRLILLPKLWLHWQISYMLGFPMIMAIAILFVHHIGLAAFDPS